MLPEQSLGPIVLFAGLAIIYLWALSKRLRGPNPTFIGSRNKAEDLAGVSYENIDLLKSIPTESTQVGYAVVGGSGFLGTYIVRLLLLRGERYIRVLDLHPPSTKIASHPAVSFVKTDITSLQSVLEGLTQPFTATGRPPKVIYHTAATIRFWERLSYCWNASYKINVSGTANVLAAAKELPLAIFIYTSTADTVIPKPNFFRLRWNRKSNISDFDKPLPPSQFSDSCYSRSKLVAEQLVTHGDGERNLRTGIIRPGYTIIGPNDRLLTSTLIMPRVPVWDKRWSSTSVCVWDVAAAHLLMEDALTRDMKDVRGQAFLITGKDAPWSLEDVREGVKFFVNRPIILDDIPPLPIYLLAHLVEGFLYVRYHSLFCVYWLFGSQPTLVPSWMGQIVYLQPATFEYWSDIVIDDSRARKVLGYYPQWGTAQCIRYTVDEVQSGKAGTSHGLQLKS
ncbi:hypothetical protein BDZ94DRAFT_1245763 [Collybia nuda]|uniref:3-beta hydroxysteroid dehydrogenase/isomerase domain-containing protein n=1 Tax=Collybia nuda TaxID=64659 RepID=A0A9P5YH73_9AGAR|nr:hypothetical protein BDZ94DRAFT_1245763 [Collybia nuda]